MSVQRLKFIVLLMTLAVGLQDTKANAYDLRKMIPKKLPSGRTVAIFQ